MAVRKTSTKGAIIIDSVGKAKYQKSGSLTAQVRQVLTHKSFYPSKSVDNEMSDNLFEADEFGFEEQEFTSTETRVAWMLVPEGTTPEQVVERLASKNGACLYKVLANKPILTNDQRYSINAGQKTLDDYANAQVIRYPEDAEKANQVIKDDNGNVQYRRVFFSATPKEDMDLRTSEAEAYMSEEISAELNEGVIPEAIVIDDAQMIG